MYTFICIGKHRRYCVDVARARADEKLCEIPGSHGGKYYDCLLGCCAVIRAMALMMEAGNTPEKSVNFY
jgi:hypothetical protein